jgi:L-threonylcarbamoyladenylate synthase
LSDHTAAVAELEAGRAIVLPTDTVYGVGVMPGVPGAIEGLFGIKQRSRDKPIPVLASSPTALSGIVSFTEPALRLADRFWPGPLTLVLSRAPGFTARLSDPDSETVAVRVPHHPVAADVLGLTGPLAVTSANLSGQKPATSVAEARAALGAEVRVFVDGGVCAGMPSTIVSCGSHVAVLREGAITSVEIEAAVSRG